jgi:hypothetical protein
LLHSGWWLRFEDSNGPGWAQPDFFFLEPDGTRIVLIEAKLSETPAGWEQLDLLYRPLLQKLFPAAEILSVQACQNLARGRDAERYPVVTELKEIQSGVVFHYLGW